MNKSARLIASMCVAEVATMAGVFAFPALLPTFVTEWALSNTEAGWIAGIYFGAYAIFVPVLVALTDRVDARWIYLLGASLAVVSSGGFALLAGGFWSGLLFRALAGVALAATYMPGLKVLVDRYRGPKQSRAVALYTSNFSLGTAVSFLMAGEIAEAFGWRWAFGASAIVALVAVAVALSLSAIRPEAAAKKTRILDFRPVLANRQAMGYVLGYGVHCWELFTLRSWLVALLAFNLVSHAGDSGDWPAPTSVAMLSGLVAMFASIAGNELCVRYGRPGVIQLIMISSALMACIIGFATSLQYGVLVALALLYSALVQFDSAALTAGAIAAADPNRQGATMAIHSLLGFGCASIGPLIVGVVLDLSGGANTSFSWGLAFVSVGLIGVLGPLALRLAVTGVKGGP